MTKIILTPSGLRVGRHRIPCTVGRAGLKYKKREGDQATPRGVYRVVGTLYRADRVARPAPWAEPIGPGDLWSDDPSDPEYNRPVSAPHGYSHETLRRADRLYDIVIVTDWNFTEPQKDGGSAIFLHRWRGMARPTEGCIGMAPHHLRWLSERAEPGTPIVTY